MKYKYLGEYDDAARKKVSGMFHQTLVISPDNKLADEVNRLAVEKGIIKGK